MHWRTAIGVLILALQAAAIVRARFVNDRYFCWAPFDQQTKYEISVAIGDEGLAEEDEARGSQRAREPARRTHRNATDRICRALA